MIKELDWMVLTADLPKHSLKGRDIGTVVLVHRNGEECEVEFVTLDGETIAVVSLNRSRVRPIARRETAHARQVA